MVELSQRDKKGEMVIAALREGNTVLGLVLQPQVCGRTVGNGR